MCHTLHTQSLTASAAPDFDLFPFKVFVRKELIPVFFLTRRNFKRVFLLVANEEMDHLRMAGNLRRLQGWFCYNPNSKADSCNRILGSGAHCLSHVLAILAPWFHRHKIR